MTIAQESKTYTWTCSRCHCQYTDSHLLIPAGWSELDFNEHNMLGLKRFYFCEHCSHIVREVLGCWQQTRCEICEENHE